MNNILSASFNHNLKAPELLEQHEDTLKGSDSDPIVTYGQVVDLIERSTNKTLTLHGDLEIDIPLVDTISFIGSDDNFDDEGTFVLANSLDENPSIKIILKGYPRQIQKKQDLLDMPETSFFRLVWENGNNATLYAIKDKQSYIGDYLSRTISIFGSQKTNRQIVRDKLNVKVNPEAFFKATFNDSVFETLRNSEVMIIGGGTVGLSAADILSRLGVNRISYSELPDELIEPANTQRMVNHSAKHIWMPKWRAMMNMILSNNPFADVEYMGAFDDGNNIKKSKFIDEVIEERLSQSQGELYVILALDQLRHRQYAQKLFQDSAYIRMSPTDIGNGSLLQIHTKGEVFNISESESPLHAIIEMLGGAEFAANNFDLETLAAFLSMGQGAYGAFPQTHTSAYMTSVMLSIAMVRLASGQGIPKVTFDDPSGNFVLDIPKLKAKRRRLLEVVEH